MRRSARVSSCTGAWSRALLRTATIASHPERTLPVLVEEIADTRGGAPALLSGAERFTYRALADRSAGYSRWALENLDKGDVVCLLMPNRPEYMAAWLGISRVGGIVALINTSLGGAALADAVNSAAPKHLVVAAALIDRMRAAEHALAGAPQIWIHGDGDDRFPRIDRRVDEYAGGPLRGHERRRVSIDDHALYIYTSGTTGASKAAIVSHARVLQWSHWFAGLMDASPNDRMYDCLPMYHSAGGVLATGALLVAGGSVVIRDTFSDGHFWRDVIQWECTLFQYIGELCRYLLQGGPSADAIGHRVRLCCGNGLRSDIWDRFKEQFRIPHILEFYASTEGNVSLANIDGPSGSVGRVPPFLAHRFPGALVKHDAEQDAPLRDGRGFCVRCAPREAGEAIGRLVTDPANVGSRYEGYTDRAASDNKILRDVFEPGDAWVRTGDLLSQDEQGFFYFVDRIGDTFRWKGENVATSDVADAICAFPGIKDAAVYGVAIPGTDGRAGMAAIVADAALDLAALRSHLVEHLPDYARPIFLRIRCGLPVTATFKHTKQSLIRDGYDPSSTSDAIYFDDRECEAFVPLDKPQYRRIRRGALSRPTRARATARPALQDKGALHEAR
jgi:fatty-acyl-CoA synthase